MKQLTIFSIGVILISLNAFSSAFASEGHHHHFNGNPVKAMAEIVIGLKHFPSKSEKRQLNDIISHSKDENIKVVGKALLHMRHTATDSDKKKLEEIMNNTSVDSDVRLLAKIIHDLHHKPNRSDKQKLSKLSH